MLIFQHFTKSPFALFRKAAAILYNICTTKVMLYFGTAIACRKNLFEMPGMGFLECDSSWESHCSPETSFGSPSKELHGDIRTGLCISKSMMMARQVVPASRCHCLELMIRKAATEMPTGCGQCIVKNIVRIVHLVDPVNGLQAAFIEAGVVRHQWVILQQWMDLLPDLREHRRVLRILRPKTVHLAAEPLVVFRLRMNEAVEGIHDNVIADNDYADAAHAARLLVRSLEVQAII